jgi:hypothetical protein
MRRSESGGKVTLLSREVASVPLATFCELLCTSDALLAEDAKSKFLQYCGGAPYASDWRVAWRDFMAARGIDHGAALRARIEARAGALRHLRPLSKVFPAALRRVIRAHSGQPDAFEKAIAGFGKFSARYEQPAYLPLCVEVLPVSSAGVPAVSVAHYGEQGGDLMRDPEIVFAVVSVEAWLPYEITQDYTGHYCNAWRNDIFHPSLSASINALASVWARNLGGQDWPHAACVRFRNESANGRDGDAANLSRAGVI